MADAIQTEDKTATLDMSLKPGEQVIIPNFVQFMRERGIPGVAATGLTYAGPLLVYSQTVTVEGNDGVFVGARTSVSAGVGKFGVFYAAVPFNRVAGTSAWVYGLQQNGETRTNLAIASPFSININPDVFSIDLYDGNTGLKVKTLDGITIYNNGWKQLGGLLAEYAPGISQGYAHIKKTGGGGGYFVPYAVINDGGHPGERTGDGAFISSAP